MEFTQGCRYVNIDLLYLNIVASIKTLSLCYHGHSITFPALAGLFNGAVEQCPGGASVSNSWFSRSGAEGESGVRCSTAPFSLRGAEGERALSAARLFVSAERARLCALNSQPHGLKG